MRFGRLLVVGALLLVAMSRVAHADRVEELTKALAEDASYKVRVQAALVLGKLGDARAVPTLLSALAKDDNETVRGVAAASLGYLGDRSTIGALKAATADKSAFVVSQAKKALAMLGVATTGPVANAGAKFYFSIGFQSAAKFGAEYAETLRSALTTRLQKFPTVTLSVGTPAEPSEKMLTQKHLTGFLIDGTVQKLSASNAGGMKQIDCDIKAYIATFPGKSIKVMTQEGASLQTGMAVSAESSAKRECLQAAAESLGDDVEKFLRTLE